MVVVRKIEGLVMVCMVAGIVGGIGLKHYFRSLPVGATEIRIDTPTDPPSPEAHPAATNSLSPALDETAMNSR